MQFKLITFFLLFYRTIFILRSCSSLNPLYAFSLWMILLQKDVFSLKPEIYLECSKGELFVFYSSLLFGKFEYLVPLNYSLIFCIYLLPTKLWSQSILVLLKFLFNPSYLLRVASGKLSYLFGELLSIDDYSTLSVLNY